MSGLTIRNADDLRAVEAITRNPTGNAFKILYGLELGLGTVSAVESVVLVKGKPTLKAHAWAGLIKKSGRYNYTVTKHTNTECVIEWTENGKSCGVPSSFTEEDAKLAGLGGENWRKYPKAMLFARALTQGARMYCPDVAMGGIYTPEEIDEGYENHEAEAHSVDSASVGQEPEVPTEGDALPGSLDDDAYFRSQVLDLASRHAQKEDIGDYIRMLQRAKGVKSLTDLTTDQRAALIEEMAQARMKEGTK